MLDAADRYGLDTSKHKKNNEKADAKEEKEKEETEKRRLGERDARKEMDKYFVDRMKELGIYKEGNETLNKIRDDFFSYFGRRYVVDIGINNAKKELDKIINKHSR
jgi:hypothetical protein